MKQIIIPCLIFLFVINNIHAQIKTEKTNGLFYKISLAITLTINEEYQISNDDDAPFINPSAFFINNTIGYQFDQRSTIGLNLEYDWHSKQGLNFLPLYLSFQYNIIQGDENLFIRGGYGTLWQVNKAFEKGNIYKFGIGIQFFDDNFKNSWLIGLDYTRKRFGFRNSNKLSSVSVFIEFMLF